MKSTFRLFVFAFLLASLARPAFAEPELKGLPGELTEYLKGVPKTVTVTGESEVKVEADKATASLRVQTENKSFQEASPIESCDQKQSYRLPKRTRRRRGQNSSC